MNKKRIAILGSTGSIGTQALEIIQTHPDQFQAEVLTAWSNYELLIRQALQFQPNAVVIGKEEHYSAVKEALAAYPIKVFSGEASLTEIVEMESIDMVLNSMMGAAGLKPTLHAIRYKKPIALANKETLVVAGELVQKSALENHCPLLPVDSEHSAIFQCLLGEEYSPVKRILLTGSGGPFRGKSRCELENVTPTQALRHPTWNMGKKISIDSASLMNKGLEIIEAKWLFDVRPEQIEVIIHPESVIHSMVEFEDGSIKAQLGVPSMKLPIQFAFSFPQRIPSTVPPLDFRQYAQFHFQSPDEEVFKNLSLAKKALKRGGNMCCILNAANEIVVQAFLEGKIPFLSMPDFIEQCMAEIPFIAHPNLEELLETDRASRTLTQNLILQSSKK